MTTELQTTTKKDSLLASLEVRGMDIRQFRVIKDVLYPNVQKEETLLMALDYCKARKLDIFKRSIQIVPIWDKNKKCLVDTIWPSISEVRTTATRTGKYAGISEAEFGEDITEKLDNVEVSYPKWCKITVFRLVEGQKCAFSAKLFWKQEYKTAKNDTVAPNSMWAKRTHAQLEKCCEAAALRKAFPEEIGNEYIGEEAFSSDDMIDVTSKSKTASAHNPPAALKEVFEPKPDISFEAKEEPKAKIVEAEQTDITDYVEEQEPEETPEQKALNEKADALYNEIKDKIAESPNLNGLTHAFNYIGIKDGMKFLEQKKPSYFADLSVLKQKRMAEFKKWE